MTIILNQEMATIHDRMPVILPEDKQEIWLDEATDEDDLLADLLLPLFGSSLNMFKDNKYVNVVKNNYGDQILQLNSI